MNQRIKRTLLWRLNTDEKGPERHENIIPNQSQYWHYFSLCKFSWASSTPSWPGNMYQRDRWEQGILEIRAIRKTLQWLEWTGQVYWAHTPTKASAKTFHHEITNSLPLPSNQWVTMRSSKWSFHSPIHPRFMWSFISSWATFNFSRLEMTFWSVLQVCLSTTETDCESMKHPHHRMFNETHQFNCASRHPGPEFVSILLTNVFICRLIFGTMFIVA